MQHDLSQRAPKTERKAADYAGIVDLNPAPLDLMTPPSARLLIALAARRWGVAEALLATHSRDTLVVAARHHAMWLLRTHRGCSLPQIGRLLGGRDHTSVINGIAKHIARMEGRVPLPFIWTQASAETVVRYARSGSLLGEIRRNFAIGQADLFRHPRFSRLKALAAIESNYRQIHGSQRRSAS